MIISTKVAVFRWTVSLFALTFLACGGCNSDANEAEDSAPARLPARSARIRPTPDTSPIAVTYRVSGAARAITGTYTDETGQEIAIPIDVSAGGAALPWEKTVQLPSDLMRTQHIQVFLSARDASGANAVVTVEMWVEGKKVNSADGPAPRIYIQKH